MCFDQGHPKNHHPNQNRAPNSALSVLREVKFDPVVRDLTAQPLEEYRLLHNGTLFAHQSPLRLPAGGKLLTLPLGGAGGSAIDLSLTVPLSSTAGSQRLSVGLSVLATAQSLANSTAIQLTVEPPSAGGFRAGNLSVGIEWPADNPPLPTTWRPWSAPFRVRPGQASVDLRVLVDRSIVEVFANGGQAAGLLAYLPSSAEHTSVHLFSRGEEAATVEDVQVFSMGCGWSTVA